MVYQSLVASFFAISLAAAAYCQNHDYTPSEIGINGTGGFVRIDQKHPLILTGDNVYSLNDTNFSRIGENDFLDGIPADVNAKAECVTQLYNTSEGRIKLVYRDKALQKNRSVFLKIALIDGKKIIQYDSDYNNAAIFKPYCNLKKSIFEKRKNILFMKYEYVKDGEPSGLFLALMPVKIDQITETKNIHQLYLDSNDKSSEFYIFHWEKLDDK